MNQRLFFLIAFLSISNLFVMNSKTQKILAEDRNSEVQEVNELQSQVTKDHVTTVRGIISRNPTGTIDVELTYDAQQNKYSGTVYNHNFSLAAWYSMELSAHEAEKLYKQLTAKS